MKKLLVAFLILPTILLAQRQPYNLLIPYRDHAKWGFADSMGKIVIQPAYDSVHFFAGNDGYQNGPGKFARVIINGRMGLVDKEGNLVVPCEYDEFEIFNRCLIARKGKQFGLLNDHGEVIVPAVYDEMILLKGPGGFFRFKKGNKYGVASHKKILLPLEYKMILPDDIDGIAYTFDDKMITFDQRGKILKEEKIEPKEFTSQTGARSKEQYERGESQSDDVVPVEDMMISSSNSSQPKTRSEVVKVNGKYGYVYQGRKWADKEWSSDSLPAVYDSIGARMVGQPSQEYITVKKNGKWGAVNFKQEILMPFEYDGIDRATDKMIYVVNKGKRGIFNIRTGTIWVPVLFDEIKGNYYPYSLRAGKKWGIMFSYNGIPSLSDCKYSKVGESIHLSYANTSLIKVFNQKGQMGFLSHKGIEFFKD